MKIKKMNFYKRKQKWKYALFAVAIIISALSIYLTGTLEKSLEESINSLSQSIETLKQNEETLKREEADNMANFANAIQHLNNMDPETEGDYSLSIEIVERNVSIPLILIDECDDVLTTKNLNIPIEIDSLPEKKKTFILTEPGCMDRLYSFGPPVCVCP